VSVINTKKKPHATTIRGCNVWIFFTVGREDPLEWLETQWYGYDSLYLRASGSSTGYRCRPPVPISKTPALAGIFCMCYILLS
jgi:hypothetical protein